MNIRSNPDTTLPAVTTGPLPSSRKIFANPDAAPDLKVPLREIMLWKTRASRTWRCTTPRVPTPIRP